MIDMVFLLLVFFMIASKLSQQQRVEMEIPTASKAVVPEKRHNRWTVNILQDGSLYSGESETSMDNLITQVKDSLKQNPNLQVYLRADARCEHREVKKVMNSMAEIGIDNFIFGVYVPTESKKSAGAAQ